MRTFDTGATRDKNENKIEYARHLSPIVLKRYCEYMHECRKTPEGLRDPDNWKLGIPKQAYMDSLYRHVQDLWLLHTGEGVGSSPDKEETLCAIMFNTMGYLFEELKNGTK